MDTALKELENAVKTGIYRSMESEGIITAEQLSQLLELSLSHESGK